MGKTDIKGFEDTTFEGGTDKSGIIRKIGGKYPNVIFEISSETVDGVIPNDLTNFKVINGKNYRLKEKFMLEFKDCNKDEQITVLLSLAENLYRYFSKDEYKMLAKHITETCREWEKDKIISPDELYKFIDSGGDEDISVIQEESESYDIELWDCYIYIIAYVCKIAYEYDNQVYVPQIIESVDDSCYEIIKEICQNIKILPSGIYNNISIRK
jgi:hypothetical protein